MTVRTFDTESGAVTRWIEDIIIGLNLCPFAKKPFIANQIQLRWAVTNKRIQVAEEVLSACQELDENPGIETTLVIFPESLKSFEYYLDALECSQQALLESEYEGIYQLASFHPEYLFEGEDFKDASHFTNRAPYPIIHIIREQSIDSVLKTYRNPEEIPQRNMELMRSLGIAYLENLFSALQR